MLILKRLVEMTEGAFERKLRENREKSGFGLFLENPREVEKTHVWVVNKNKHIERLFNKRGGKMTGAWLLANDLKQISDCTGGRIGDAVRYCQSEQK